MRIRLVVPVDVEDRTGGNAYDLALADALREGGDETETVRCEPDELADILATPAPGHVLVDGLLACPQPGAISAGRPAVLVHMPLGLDATSDAVTARLQGLEREALRAASVVIATSEWSAGWLRDRHGVADVHVARPGVEPAPLSRGSDPPLIAHVAALVPNKNQLAVIAALSELQRLPWRARLAGSVDRDPAYADAVRAAVADAGLSSRVDIPGTLDRDAAWAGADLAVLPSLAEAYGMAVTEALMRGVPAVVSDGGAAEALGVAGDGQRPGIVVSPGDVVGLRDALGRWLSDPRLRADLRERALTRRASLQGWSTTARLVREALLHADRR